MAAPLSLLLQKQAEIERPQFQCLSFTVASSRQPQTIGKASTLTGKFRKVFSLESTTCGEPLFYFQRLHSLEGR